MFLYVADDATKQRLYQSGWADKPIRTGDNVDAIVTLRDYIMERQ